jgi:hypothetical protein
LTTSVSGVNLNLTWPLTRLGWTLQAQTNTLTAGLGRNWVDVVNTTATNQMVIQSIAPAAPCSTGCGDKIPNLFNAPGCEAFAQCFSSRRQT